MRKYLRLSVGVGTVLALSVIVLSFQNKNLTGKAVGLFARRPVAGATSMPACSSNAPTAAPAELQWIISSYPYQDRLAGLQWLGQEFPGYRLVPSDTLGLWGGIQRQTDWQRLSARSADAWWSLNNWSLSVVPKILGQYYRDRGFAPDRLPTNGEIADLCRDANLPIDVQEAKWPAAGQPAGALPPSSASEACVSLFKFFRESDKLRGGVSAPIDTFKSQLRMLHWHYHEVAIQKANWGLQTTVHACAAERRFQQGWLNMVTYVAASNIPGNEAGISPAQALTMPYCFPLGASYCNESTLPSSVVLFYGALDEFHNYTLRNPQAGPVLAFQIQNANQTAVNTFSGLSFLITGNTANNRDVAGEGFVRVSQTSSMVVNTLQQIPQGVSCTLAIINTGTGIPEAARICAPDIVAPPSVALQNALAGYNGCCNRSGSWNSPDWQFVDEYQCTRGGSGGRWLPCSVPTLVRNPRNPFPDPLTSDQTSVRNYCGWILANAGRQNCQPVNAGAGNVAIPDRAPAALMPPRMKAMAECHQCAVPGGECNLKGIIDIQINGPDEVAHTHRRVTEACEKNREACLRVKTCPVPDDPSACAAFAHVCQSRPVVPN